VAAGRDGSPPRVSRINVADVLAGEANREVLNFGSDAPDEEVHAAFASLIRKGALVVTQEKWGEIPEWKLAPGALTVARETVSLGTDLRTRYGLSETD